MEEARMRLFFPVLTALLRDTRIARKSTARTCILLSCVITSTYCCLAQLNEILLLLLLSAVERAVSLSPSARDDHYLRQTPELIEPTQQQSGNEVQRYLETLKLSREALDPDRSMDELRRDLNSNYERFYPSGEMPNSVDGGLLMAPSLFNQRLMMALRSVSGNEFDYGRDKKGKYMSLCHFKICNMGRKRWKAWP